MNYKFVSYQLITNITANNVTKNTGFARIYAVT